MSVRACPKCERNSFETRRDGSWWCLYASCGHTEQAVDELQALRDEMARLRGAIVWALGYTDFRAREEGEGAYWWRPELRRRAALTPEQIEQAKAALTPQAGKGGGA